MTIKFLLRLKRKENILIPEISWKANLNFMQEINLELSLMEPKAMEFFFKKEI